MSTLKFLKTILLATAVFSGFTSVAQKPDYSKLTEKNHPRLFFTEQDFKNLAREVKKGENAALVTLHESMMDIAAKDGLSDRVVTFDAEKQKATFNGTARMIANRIISASYAYRMSGDKAYLEHVISNINLFADNFERWTTGYWLENSELCLSFAIAYDWLYKNLPNSTKNKLIKSLEISGYEAAKVEKKAWFYKSWNNWNPVCNASLTCAAISTYERHPEESAAVIEKAIATVPIALKGIYEPDGASAEGPSYWDYASNYIAIFNTALESTFGTDFGMSAFDGFRKGARFRLFAVSNTGQWFNYADCNTGGGGYCLALWYFAWKYGRTDVLFRDTEYLKTGKVTYSRALFMAIWCALKLGQFETRYPEELLYTSAGEASQVIARSGWQKDDAYLGLKGGKCKVNHSHMDEGSFVYETDGVRWAGEFPHPSYEDYRRAKKALAKEDKSFKWYDKFVYNNRRHSTLTVNDCDMNEYGFAPVIDSFNTPERRGGTLDLSEMFKGQVAKTTRTAVLINGHDLEIEDEITALPDKPAHVRWTLVTDADIKLTKGGIILEKEGKKMLVKADRRVGYKTWPSDPKDYNDNPVRRFESKSSKYWSDLCGYEFDIPAGSTISVKTHFSSIKQP